MGFCFRTPWLVSSFFLLCLAVGLVTFPKTPFQVSPAAPVALIFLFSQLHSVATLSIWVQFTFKVHSALCVMLVLWLGVIFVGVYPILGFGFFAVFLVNLSTTPFQVPSYSCDTVALSCNPTRHPGVPQVPSI